METCSLGSAIKNIKISKAMDCRAVAEEEKHLDFESHSSPNEKRIKDNASVNA